METPEEYYKRIKNHCDIVAKEWARLNKIELNEERLNSLSETFHIMHLAGAKEILSEFKKSHL